MDNKYFKDPSTFGFLRIFIESQDRKKKKERKRDRETDKQTDRQKERKKLNAIEILHFSKDYSFELNSAYISFCFDSIQNQRTIDVNKKKENHMIDYLLNLK